MCRVGFSQGRSQWRKTISYDEKRENWMRLKCMARLQNLTNLFKKGGRRDVFTVNKIDSYLKKTQSYAVILHFMVPSHFIRI